LFDTHVSSTNKTDGHDVTEILLKVVLNIITLTLYYYFILFTGWPCSIKGYKWTTSH